MTSEERNVYRSRTHAWLIDITSMALFLEGKGPIYLDHDPRDCPECKKAYKLRYEYFELQGREHIIKHRVD